MSKLHRLAFAGSAVVALLMPLGASAQGFPFTPKLAPDNMDPTEDIQFKSASGVGGFGTQVGPYTGQLKSYPGNPLITIYCVDFLHGIATDQLWTANVSKLTDVASVADTRLGIAGDDADAFARYKKAAWLASNFMTNQNQTSWKQIHSAIWTFVIAGPTGQPYSGHYGTWFAAANTAEMNNYYGMDFANWAVLTDIRADDGSPSDDANVSKQPGVQEYLVQMTATPEPETIVLLLSGLLILGLAYRRGVVG
jgi:hypothetical protein